MEKEDLNKKLFEAARDGDNEKVVSLLSEGAEIDYKDETGDTAFTWAAYGSHDEIIEILLGNGQDINFRG